MSIELHEEECEKVRVLNLRGKLTKEDYAYFAPDVERASSWVVMRRWRPDGGRIWTACLRFLYLERDYRRFSK